MNNNELIFEKIEAKKKEWENQIKNLELRSANFDYETQIKIKERIDILHSKFKELEERNNELRQISYGIPPALGEKIIHSWVELFTRIDNAMLKLKK